VPPHDSLCTQEKRRSERTGDSVGLKPTHGLARQADFALTLVGGTIVAAAVANGVGVTGSRLLHLSAAGAIGLLVVQPFLEELLFRGVIQGWLRDRSWGRSRTIGVSAANLTTSILFVAAHLAAQPLQWAIAVVAPSLVFGYFRDRYDSVLPGLLLHIAFNAAFFTAPLAMTPR
jgi:membrane protease YdiL (CAAX protease family)